MTTNRRDFLTHASAGVAATTVLASTAARAAATSANDKLVVGLVGCGGRGTHVGERFKNTPNVEVAYCCDVDEGRLAATAAKLGVETSRSVGDLRRILDDKAVDVVIVAAPDHWHTPGSILACDAGKHVYVEKPISHNLREGRLLVEASQRNNVLVQHGTQCRSTPMMIEAVRALRDGLIGDVLVAKCWNIQRRGSLGHGQDVDPPAGFNYDDWIGPATMVPYRTNRVHKRWTMWYHFGVGEIGNDGVHDVDYARWGLGVEGHPNKVSSEGGKYSIDDDTEFPDTQQVTYEYSGNGKVGDKRMLIYEQRLWSVNYPYNVDSGAEFYGTRGMMFLSRRGKIQVWDDKKQPVAINVAPHPQDDVLHVKNLCDAIRGDAKQTADALTGHLTTSLCHLGNISTRLGRSLRFDPQAEHVVDDAEADALLRREYRDHWATPKGV